MKRQPSKGNNSAALGNSPAGHRKRLRDKFSRSGLEGFHDYEAIELLLTFAIPRRDVKPVAKELLRRFKTLKGVFEASSVELASVKGVGDSAATLLTLLREAAGAYLKEYGASNVQIKSPKDVVDFLRSNRGNDAPEGSTPANFVAVYLNSKNEVLDLKESEAGFSFKDIVADAIRHNARSIIFTHLNAEGASSEAAAAKKTAKSMQDAALALDILVHDYIVITGDAYTSAREAGWLKG
ncbi:MAG: RadC family protein [Deltaproteobacteria bacterium]|nr:RadC family protein [Deltaproteobacteria bacterium]